MGVLLRRRQRNVPRTAPQTFNVAIPVKEFTKSSVTIPRRRTFPMKIKSTLIISATVAAVIAGCSLANSGNADQCKVDSDCTAIGLTDFTCSAGSCVAKPPITVATPDSGGVGVDECTANNECVAKNGARPAICRKTSGIANKCIPIQTDDCPEVFGPWDNKDAVFMGAFYDGVPGASAASVTLYSTSKNLTSLAVSEINATGIPGGTGGARRPLVSVYCKGTQAAYKSMFEDLKVPVALPITDALLLPSEPFSRAAGSTNFCIFCATPVRKVSNSGDTTLLWQFTSAWDVYLPLSVKTIQDLEAQVRAERPATTQVKVAMAIGGYLPARTFGEGLASQLRFNGNKNIVENGGNYSRIDFGDFSKATVDYTKAAVDIAATGADVIVMAVSSDGLTLLPLIEQNWGTGPKPRYLITPAANVAATLDIIRANPSLLSRITIVAGPSNNAPTPELLNLRSRYSALFPTGGAIGQIQPYDGVYTIASAIAAAGTGVGGLLSGTDIARAMSKLNVQGAPRYVTEPNSLPSIYSGLVNGGNVDLVGMSGTLDFDIALGYVLLDSRTVCVSTKASDGSLALTSAGSSYSQTTKVVSGSLACPVSIP
jgi:hypothetical protein